jgi:hypothetical protein
MSNPLKVIYPDGTRAWIGQCPAEYMGVFEIAINELFMLQHEYGDPVMAFNDATVIAMVRYVASFLPILPWRETTFGVEPFLKPLNVPALTELFYGVDCAIAQMHIEEIPPENPDAEEEDPTKIPIPSSGDAIADLLAQLSLVDNNVNAMQLISRYDRGTLQAYVQQIYELKRDPKERFEEHKGKLLQKFIDEAEENDPMLYAELYGLGENNGSDQSQD